MSPFSNLSQTRRKFLAQAGAVGVVSSMPLSCRALAGWDALEHAKAGRTSTVTENRAPLARQAFYPLPLGSIRPRDWLLRQLQTQANGLSGHLDETWEDVGPNSGWLGGKGESWERGPYYLDGLLPLAFLLDDQHLKAKAQKYIDWVLENQAPNGMIGPSSNDDWWPRMVMLKVLTQYAELTGDARVAPVMDKYFRHQLQELPSRPLRDWGRFRWQDEVLCVIWLYNRTGACYLLDLVKLLHQQGYDWQAQYADFKYTERITAEFIKLNEGEGLKDLALATHGVNNGQAIKAGPVWSVVSGSTDDRKAVLQMLAVLDKYHGLPNGMFSCDEHLAGPDPSQGSELCTVVESMFSLEQALAIAGDAALGDRLERLAFNALPGTLTDDMWAHQYNQEPNQVECSLHHRPWTTDGPESNLFGLEPNFGCCTANFHQGWPKFANSLFMVTGKTDGSAAQGLVAAAYAPCAVTTMLGGVQVQVIEETAYPFEGAVHLTIIPAKPVRFAFHLRIPGWASGTTIRVNGELELAPSMGTFAQVERTWKADDRIEVIFPMKPRVSEWFHRSVAVEYGPLVFSYGIGESWVKLRDRGMTADWQIFPKTPWNYALVLDQADPAAGIVVERTTHSEATLTRDSTPIRLKVKARRVDAWRAEDGVANPVPMSPVKTDQAEETITLIPYAAAKLRITAFPRYDT